MSARKKRKQRTGNTCGTCRFYNVHAGTPTCYYDFQDETTTSAHNWCANYLPRGVAKTSRLIDAPKGRCCAACGYTPDRAGWRRMPALRANMGRRRERMTLDEAIQHAREVALSNAACGAAYRKGGQTMLADGCDACAAEHAQLADWLEELRDRRRTAVNQAGAPVAQKAYWEPSDEGEYHCTNCGEECDIDQFHKALLNRYCGNCGAEMW